MTRKEAIARAKELHEANPLLGEEPKGITRRWVELVEDRTQPGPIRDALCWVVEFCGDEGATADLYIEDATGALVRKETYS